jgi:hypothetical protein
MGVGVFRRTSFSMTPPQNELSMTDEKLSNLTLEMSIEWHSQVPEYFDAALSGVLRKEAYPFGKSRRQAVDLCGAS